MSPLRLYAIPFSTNVERVALALGHKGLSAERVDVDPADRSEVERVSGQPLVPVVDDADTVVHDSLAILRHLERRFPDAPLWPAGRARRAELDVFLDWFDRVWKGPPNEIEAELERSDPDKGRIAALSALMRERLGLFEAMLDGREYLFGSELTAADCSAWPFLRYALGRQRADDELFHRILDEHQPLGGDHPLLADWIRRVDARPRG